MYKQWSLIIVTYKKCNILTPYESRPEEGWVLSLQKIPEFFHYNKYDGFYYTYVVYRIDSKMLKTAHFFLEY
jgi:hypothetical protein